MPIRAPLGTSQHPLSLYVEAIVGHQRRLGSVFRATAHWFPIVALEPPLDLPIDRASMVWHECVHDDPGHVWLRQRFDAWMRERTEPARKKKSGKGERASRR